MAEIFFQEIFDKVSEFLPANWEKTVVYLEYGEASYTFLFYVKVGGKYYQCYSLAYATEEEILNAFKEIDKKVGPIRKKEKTPWSNMTLVVEANGKMQAYYSYEDLSKGTFQYMKKWKGQYLV